MVIYNSTTKKQALFVHIRTKSAYLFMDFLRVYAKDSRSLILFLFITNRPHISL